MIKIYDIDDIEELNDKELTDFYYIKARELDYDMEIGDITSKAYIELQAIYDELKKRGIEVE